MLSSYDSSQQMGEDPSNKTMLERKLTEEVQKNIKNYAENN